MKKSIKVIIAVAAAFMVLVCMSGAVLADDGNPGQVEATATQGTTNLSYTVGDGYVLKVPPEVKFNDGMESTPAEYSITGVKLASGQKLVVTVTATNFDETNGFRLGYPAESAASFIPYEVCIGDSSEACTTKVTALDTLKLDSSSGSADPSGGVQVVKYLKFTTSETSVKKAKLAGEHTSKLTFSAAVES